MTAVALGRLVWVAAAVIAVTIGLAAGPLPWRLMGESGLPAPAGPATAPAAVPVALEPILALTPFGRRAAPEAPEPAQETGLGLTLHGVVIAASPAASSAIVSGEGEPARAHAVGATVAGGAVLVEVMADHVVLEIDGRRETLSFPERRQSTSGGGGGASPGSAPTGGGGVAALRALVTSQAPQPAATPADPAAAAESGSDPEAAIADLRARVQANPRAVLDGLGLQAGEAGYTVGPEPSEALRGAGLQPGDVVIKVNGQQVGNIDTDRRLFDEVVASGRARVEVLRDGQAIALSFPLR